MGVLKRLTLILWMMIPLLSQAADTLALPSLVYVEGYDSKGVRMSLGTGVIVKNGFVAVNYFYVVGMAEVVVYKQGSDKKYISNGYLSAEEGQDMVIISAPGLTGTPATFWQGELPEEGTVVKIIDGLEKRNLKISKAVIKGRKEIRDQWLTQIISDETDECIGGPVFIEGKVAAFVTAGYWDEKAYSYIIPSAQVLRLMKRSFIIKALNSLEGDKVLKASYFQANLMEGLTAVLWMPFEDALRLAAKKNKKILVDVYTPWCGWCKIMNKNTYSQKKIIRYINENYYAVRLNAETRDTLFYKGRKYTYSTKQRANELAYSLLEGKMNYPSTLFLDSEANALTMVPGYLDPRKMEVVLHFLSEDAYLGESTDFQAFETAYLRRKKED